MSDGQESESYADKVKRPGVQPYEFHQIKAIADANSPVSADELSWQKCLEIVIDAYVPGSEREVSDTNKRLNAESE